METIDSNKAREMAADLKHNRLLKITMKEIKRAAKSGAIGTSINLNEYGYKDIPKYYIDELIDLGYCVGSYKSVFGNYIIDINWGEDRNLKTGDDLDTYVCKKYYEHND